MVTLNLTDISKEKAIYAWKKLSEFYACDLDCSNPRTWNHNYTLWIHIGVGGKTEAEHKQFIADYHSVRRFLNELGFKESIIDDERTRKKYEDCDINQSIVFMFEIH